MNPFCKDCEKIVDATSHQITLPTHRVVFRDAATCGHCGKASLVTEWKQIEPVYFGPEGALAFWGDCPRCGGKSFWGEGKKYPPPQPDPYDDSIDIM